MTETESDQYDSPWKEAEEDSMRYVMSFERFAEERGKKEGKKEERATSMNLLKGQLGQRFGHVPDWVEQRLLAAEGDEIVNWGLRVLQAPSVEDVFRSDAQA